MPKRKKSQSSELTKFSKRMTLVNNRFKGSMAEQNYVMGRSLQGYEVKRTGRGSDYVERKVNMWSDKKGPKTYVEVKSSRTAPLSKLQKKTKKKISRYKVVRPSGF